MRAKLAKPGQLSKTATLTREGKNPQTCGWFSTIAAELQQIFPRGCVGEIAFRAGRTPSVVEKWLNGSVNPDGEALAKLLCSDIGDRVHLALISNVKAPWADSARAVREIARIRQQQADHARRLAELEQGIR